jgi:hypothetical protein
MLSGMDRASLERRLANADKHIVEGMRHIAQQKALIQGMERLGRDTSTSKRLLRIFEETLRLHTAERDKLLRQLNAERP